MRSRSSLHLPTRCSTATNARQVCVWPAAFGSRCLLSPVGLLFHGGRAFSNCCILLGRLHKAIAVMEASRMVFGQNMSVRPIQIDVGREVHLVSVPDGDTSGDGTPGNIQLAVKHWEQDRLENNTEQVFNELRARMSSLATHHYVVLPVHVTLSREGGCLVVYPYAGRSMDAVCASLRAAGDKAQLVTQLAEMATAVILTLQKLQAQKPKPFVHRDLKLENLLLGEDGLVRLADFGSMCEQGDVSTAHDPTYFPPDWATLLPDGRHVCEDPASLAAANTLLLDLRGLGMALLKGFAGRLPAEVTLEDAGSFSTGSGSWGPGWGPCAGGQHTAFGEAAAGGFQPAPMSVGRGSAAGSSTASLSTGSYASSVPCSSPRCAPCSGSAAVQFDAQERARLLRIAQHDWAASIDARIPDAPALNQFVKLLMGPKEAVPSLSKFLQQPLIKSVHRQVLDTARKARKPWLAHVAACRAAAWRVVAPLAQLEQQLLQVYSDGSLSSMAPLSEQFEVLAEQYQEQQLQEQEKQQAQMQLAGASDACAHPGGGSSSSMECACSSARCAACSAQHALYCIAGAGGGRGTAAGLQAAVGSVLAQLSAARPEAASRIAQLQEELMQIAGGEYSTGAGSGAGTGSCARMQEVELRTAGACSFACATGAEPDHAGAGLFASVALQAGAAVLPDSAAAGGTLAVFDWNNSAGYDWKSSAGFGSGIPVQAQEWGLFAAGGTALQFSPAAPGLLVGAEMVQQPLGCTHARSADRPSALASITVSDPCSGVEGSDWCAPAEQAASQGAGATAGQELACAGLGQPPVQCEELLAAASAALQQALGVLQQRQAAARVLSAGAQGARADGDVLGLLAHAQAALQEARGLASSGVEPVSSGAGKAGSIKGVELPTELLSESEDCADIEVFLVESPTAAGARAPAAALGAQRKGLGASWAKPQTCGVAKRSGSGGRRGVGVGLARWVLLAAALVSVLQQHSVVKQV